VLTERYVSAIHSSFSIAALRSASGPLATIQPNFICGSPAIFESPLMENVRQPSTPTSVLTRATSGANA